MNTLCESCDTPGTTWHTGYRGHYCPYCTQYIATRENIIAQFGEDSVKLRNADHAHDVRAHWAV